MGVVLGLAGWARPSAVTMAGSLRDHPEAGITMPNHEKLIDFLTGTLRPVGTALVIAAGAAFFEGAFPAPNVGGHWYCLTLTEEALGGEQYKGMFLLYDTFLRVNGEALTGNDEKSRNTRRGERDSFPGKRGPPAHRTGTFTASTSATAMYPS